VTVVLRTCNVNLITNSNNFVKYSFISVGCRLLGRCLNEWFTTTRSTVLTEPLKLKLINLMPRYLRLYVYVHGLVLFKPSSRTHGFYKNMFSTIYLAQNTFRKTYPVPKCHVTNKLRSSETFCKVTLTHNDNNISITRFGRFSSDTYPVLRA